MRDSKITTITIFITGNSLRIRSFTESERRKCQNGWMGATWASRYIHGDHASETRLGPDRGRFSKIAQLDVQFGDFALLAACRRQKLAMIVWIFCSKLFFPSTTRTLQTMHSSVKNRPGLCSKKLEDRHQDDLKEEASDIRTEAEPFQILSEELTSSATTKDPSYCEDTESSG